MNKTLKYTLQLGLAIVLLTAALTFAFKDKLFIDNTPNTSDTMPSLSPDTVFIDGVFEGTGRGFKSDITVEVTLVSAIITDVSVLSSDESMDRDEPPVALEEVPGQFVGQSALDVLTNQFNPEIILGATRTTNGIQNAVIDALYKAIDA